MNTLSYSQKLGADPCALYDLLVRQNLEYFRNYDRSIRKLEEGCAIRRKFVTKANQKEVSGKSILKKLSPSCIQLVHQYGNNRIIGEYRIEAEPEGCRLTYLEKNEFEEASKQMNFALVSFFYRFLFRRQIRKRFDWLSRSLKGSQA